MTPNFPRANKALGQHFLNDQKVIEDICSNFSNTANSIIEIGPGPGVLTNKLSQLELPYILIEKDKRFIESLSEWVSPNQIYFEDALKINIAEIIKGNAWEDKMIWLVSNLPYNVGVPIFLKFMQVEQIKYMTLMFQKEVGEKIVSHSKKIKMNSLMALSQNYFDVKTVCKVPPSAFTPPPKVDSIVISLTRKENAVIPLSQFYEFEKFLRKIYIFKRKQLGTIVKGQFPNVKLKAIHEILKNLDVDPSVRAETFDLQTLQMLFEKIEKL